jgi:hypothetical protein
MTEHLLHPRIIESKDWATILFVLAFAIVAILQICLLKKSTIL